VGKTPAAAREALAGAKPGGGTSDLGGQTNDALAGAGGSSGFVMSTHDGAALDSKSGTSSGEPRGGAVRSILNKHHGDAVPRAVTLASGVAS
jgi:hypothetical protein